MAAVATIKSDKMSLSESEFDQVITNRVNVTDEELVAAIVGVFEGVKRYSLGKLKPLILEVERRFKNIRNKKHANGQPLTFNGHTGMKTWCPKILGYSYRQVRRMLDFKLEKEVKSRAPWSTKTADGTTVLAAFSTIQKDIRRSEKPGDYFEREAIYFTKQLYAIHWPIWKRLLIVASEDIGLADLSVSREVTHLSEVAKTVKDAKHSDLLMLVEAVAICCRAKKSRVIDNAINYEQSWTPMADEEVKKAIDDTTPHTVPVYADDDLHGVHNGGSRMDFLINEDAALGNRSNIAEIIPADYKRAYHDGFAAGVASVTPPKTKPKRKPNKAVSVESIESGAEKGFAKPIPPVPLATEPPGSNDDADEQARIRPEHESAPL